MRSDSLDYIRLLAIVEDLDATKTVGNVYANSTTSFMVFSGTYYLKIMQCNNFLFLTSLFTHKTLIDCSDITSHKCLCSVNVCILDK